MELYVTEEEDVSGCGYTQDSKEEKTEFIQDFFSTIFILKVTSDC